MKFLGYQRADGLVGIRNHVLVLSTVLCTGPVPERIAEQVPGVTPMTYRWCYPKKETFTLLKGVCTNPNVSGVLIIGLNCEGLDYNELADEITHTGKDCQVLEVRKEKGTLATIAKGVKIAQEMVKRSQRIKREPFSLERLMIGIKCGGSDTTSGLAANPATGEAMDMLLDGGGTVIFSEPLEAVGAEHILAGRAVNENVAKEILSMVNDSLSCYAVNKDGSLDLAGLTEERFMSPGNIEGGLTTLEEKSLGAISKSGAHLIEGTLRFGERPKGRGLYFMDSIGHELTDVGVLFGFVAAGAQILLLTTGRGMAAGTAVAPLIKVCGNPETYAYMSDNMDVNAGTIITGYQTITQVSTAIFDEIINIASGKQAKAEILGYNEYEFSGVAT